VWQKSRRNNKYRMKEQEVPGGTVLPTAAQHFPTCTSLPNCRLLQANKSCALNTICQHTDWTELPQFAAGPVISLLESLWAIYDTFLNQTGSRRVINNSTWQHRRLQRTECSCLGKQLYKRTRYFWPDKILLTGQDTQFLLHSKHTTLPTQTQTRSAVKEAP